MSERNGDRIGLIGWPVGHSVSPPMQNAAFAAAGLPLRYVLLETPPQRLREAVKGLAGEGYVGANVTVPYKEAILELLDAVDPGAAAVGAANTLVIRAGGVIGYNTDEAGFLAALSHGGIDPRSCRHAVVVGAGGAGRAVARALLDSGATLSLLNRTVERAERLLASMEEDLAVERGRALPFTAERLVQEVASADLLVNATTVGMHPHNSASIWPSGHAMPSRLRVVDLVYNPPETALLREAQRSGCDVVGGIEMLVQQGARAFALWTGRAAPIETMREACHRVLGGDEVP